ncbi:MAG TPA: type II asparaginase [Polyangiales bacterium]|nr:type II asparaginase [Polyangiales bacterium]
MKRSWLLALLLCAYPLDGSAQAALPKIVILATGGTIAGSADSSTSGGYQSGQVAVDVLIKAVPQLSTVASVTGEQISNIGSQNMNDEVWLKLAKRVNELARTGIDGIVITHGTDTMEETAYFLSLVAHTSKPIVLTGSMRPSTAISADGPVNIFNAVAVAADAKAQGRGVLVVLNDEIHDARSVFKSHTTKVSTFKSGDHGLLGEVQYGAITFYRGPPALHTFASPFFVEHVQTLPRVDIVYIHEGVDGGLIEAAAKLGARGIVTAGVGNGNMTDAALAALAKVAEQGVVAVRSSRVITGPTGRKVEVDDDALGLVASYELTPAKARILLRLALLTTSEPATIQALFQSF